MTIQTLHLRSNVQGKEPVAGTSAGQLPVGSIAVNFNKDEPFLTIQDSAGAIRRIAGIKVGAAAPATPTAGEAWLDTTIATKPVFKVHDGTAWQGAGSGVSTGGTAPVSPAEGDLWVDTSVSTKPSLKVYNGTAFVAVTPDASETVKGVVELASTTEATTGSDTTRAVTPAGLKAALAAQAGSSTAPSAPVAGTVWVDSSTTPSVIKVYDGTNWIAQAGATVSGATPPATPVTGTLWIDTSASPSVTKIYDGTNWVTAAPDGSAAAAIANDAKYATKEEVPWKRAGTTVSPKTAGDVVEISAGTAALPGLTPVGDPNTGVWAPAADTVAVSTNGGERLRVTADGKLGVGTSSPSATIHAVGNVYAGANITGTNDTTGLNWYNNLGLLRIQQESSQTGSCFDIYKGGTNAAQIRFKSDGSAYFASNVGIGTTSPAFNLESAASNPLKLVNGSTFDIRFVDVNGLSNIYSYGSLDLSINTRYSNSIRFKTNDLERVRIDSSGRLLVGTSSAKANFENSSTTPQFQIESTSLNGASLSILRDNNDSGGPKLFLAHGRTDAGLVSNGDELGGLFFSGGDGSEFVSGASIKAAVDGTPGADDMPSRLVFSTTAAGQSSPTQRMAILNGGQVLIGATQGFFGGVAVDGYQFQPSGNLVFGHAGTTSQAACTFYNGNGTVGTISYSGTTTAYNTSSDYRLKENVVPLTGAADRLKQLKPSQFNFIADPGKTVDGFIAHEAQAVVPECVTGEKDAVDADGKPVYQGIDQSKLVPLLTAALQEALKRIEALEAK